MRLRPAVVVVAMALAGCGSSADDRVVIEDGTLPPELASTTLAPPTTGAAVTGPPTLTASSSVTTTGVGDVAFGSTIDEAQAAAGTAIAAEEAQSDPGCYTALAAEGPAGLSFLVLDGVIARLDVTAGDVRTLSGAGIGTSVDELRELYGARLRENPGPGGSVIVTFVPSDEAEADIRIIFETAGGKVTAYRAGQLPAVDTGCG